jgi:phosphoglycerol transferase MdoB-like AlkP superfamily enzyme
MRKHFFHISKLFQRLLIALLLYSLCRIFFVGYNFNRFEEIDLWALVAGIRFDLVAVAYTNALFIILSLLPFRFREKMLYQKSLLFIFLISNAAGTIVNLTDTVFYHFTLKRSTADIFKLEGMQNDIKSLIPQLITDYWFVLLIWMGLIYLSYFLYKKTIKPAPLSFQSKLQYFGVQFLLMIFGAAVAIIMTRGGLQEKPIHLIAAGKHTAPSNIPIVLNSVFTLIKTLDNETVEPVEFFSDTEALAIFNPVKFPQPTGEFKKRNVVIIILESFSAEYTGLGKSGESYSPFLDSLLQEGLLFSNAFANGKRSIDGIPSILASIPSYTPNAFITSPFSVNTITSFATLLKNKGYESSFFHGGNNGTMGFDDFVSLAGFDRYYGRTEYQMEKKSLNADYDGNWGIWDEEFLMWYADKLYRKKQPFLSSVFTLSSHHPFSIPEKYKNVLSEGTHPIHRTIRYTDLSLRRFFENIKSTDWYSNTLFVITADHTGPPGNPSMGNLIDQYHVPLLFFSPGNSQLKGKNEKITQHLDILPTVMDYLNYDQPFFSYGNSALDRNYEGMALIRRGEVYQIIKNDKVMIFDGVDKYSFSDLVTRANITEEGIEAEELEQMKKKMKAVLQVYHRSMMDNKLSVP